MTFDTNKATGRGGAVNAATNVCILTGCSFLGDNQATGGGGKVARRGGLAMNFSHTGCINFDPLTDLFEYNL